MKIEIKSWLTSKVIFECEADSLKLGVEMAVHKGVSLQYADLTRANLTRANLTEANLTEANLTEANLTRADLTRADLTRADLTRANLTEANLTEADLTEANLTRADLTEIRDDYFAVLSEAPAEVPALIAALEAGRVNGSAYRDDSGCGCLIGTLAIARDPNDRVCEVLGDIEANSYRPAERFFMGIKKGDTPITNSACKLARDWASEWLERMQKAFGQSSCAQCE